jgi:uncharacterized membrane protein YdbT with pleckstrin-like domain
LSESPEKAVVSARPSGWCFFWHWVFFFLMIPPIVALIRRASLTLTVYEDRIALRTGFLSRDIREVYISDIRTLDVKQTFGQRLLNIGTVMISSAGESGYEIIAPCLPNPLGIKEAITRRRRALKPAPD